MRRLFRSPDKDDGGAVSTEHALLISLLAIVIIVGAGALGTAVSGVIGGAAGSIP